MQVKSRISIDLRRRAVQEVVNAVQNDSNTRVIEIQLFDGGTAWTVPAGTTIALGYRKADGKRGVYDTLPNGQKACTFSGSTVTIILAKQVLTTPGMVDAVITMHDAAYNQLSTIPFSIRVHEDPSAGTVKSEDYYNYTSWEELNAAVDAWFQEQDNKIAATLDGIKRVSSPSIVEPVVGEVITVSDASDLPLPGLKVFGKTTQNGTPTPAAPVPLESVGDVTVYVCGVNLIDLADFELVAPSARAYTYNLPKPIPAGTYYLTCKRSGTSKSTGVRLQGDSSRGTDVAINSSGTVQLTLAYEVKSIYFYISSSQADGATAGFENIILSVEPGTAYEAYKEIHTLSLPEVLCGIPVESGGNYPDSTGKKWLCDEVDFVRGVYVQRIGVAEFDGTQSVSAVADIGTCVRWRHTIADISIDYTLGDANGFYTHGQYEHAYNSDFAHGYTAGNNAYLFAPKTVVGTTADEIKAYEAAQYAAGTPLSLVYPLASEKEYPLSAAQLAAFAELHSNYPNTTVFNDKGAEMEVKYVADTKLYIDKKFNELAAALVSNV